MPTVGRARGGGGRSEPGGGRLAVDAGDGRRSGCGRCSPSGNIMSTIASPTGRGVPDEGSRCMRRPGPALTSTIDAALLFQRAADVAATTSIAGDVQADHPRRLDGAGGDFGVDAVGHVGRRCRRCSGSRCGGSGPAGPAGGTRVGREALLGQDGQGDRRRARSCSGRVAWPSLRAGRR